MHFSVKCICFAYFQFWKMHITKCIFFQPFFPRPEKCIFLHISQPKKTHIKKCIFIQLFFPQPEKCILSKFQGLEQCLATAGTKYIHSITLCSLYVQCTGTTSICIVICIPLWGDPTICIFEYAFQKGENAFSLNFGDSCCGQRYFISHYVLWCFNG